MVKDSLYGKISELIDQHSRFESTEFNTTAFKEKNSYSATVELKITYTIEPKYSISFHIPNSSKTNSEGDMTYEFHGKMCPGPLAYEETFKFNGIRGLYTRVTNWLDNIWDELMSNPVVKHVSKQREAIDELVDKLSSASEGYFTKEEAIDLRQRLDNLEADFQTQFEEVTNSKKELDDYIASLHNDIDTLKQTVNSLSKKSWIQSFGGKVLKWTTKAENRKLLKDGYDVVKEFLPEHYKRALPESANK